MLHDWYAAVYNAGRCAHASGLPDWKDGATNPSPVLVENQIRKMILDLTATAGSNRINSQERAGANLYLPNDVSIFSQLSEITDFINLMLDSRANTWGGEQEFQRHVDFGCPGTEFQARFIPNASAPSTGSTGSLQFVGNDLDGYIAGLQMGPAATDWVYFAASPSIEYSFSYPIECGAESDGHVANPWHLDWQSGDWFTNNDSPYYVVFPLNRFLKNNSILRHIHVRVKPGIGEPTDVFRMELLVVKKDLVASGWSTIASGIYADSSNDLQDLECNDIDEVIITQGVSAKRYAFMIRCAQNPGLDRICGAKVWYKQNAPGIFDPA